MDMTDKKERMRRYLIAIISAVFLLMAYLCSGQVIRLNRYTSNPEIITLVPSVPMKFNDGSGDTIYVSISADSLAPGDYDCRIFMFRSDVLGYGLKIGFGGHTSTFNMATYKPEFDYAELEVPDDDLNLLKSQKIDYIAFYKDGLLEPCVNIKTPEFFINFLKQLK